MRLLVMTNLFPSSKEPTRGMYNLQLVRELRHLCELKVVAPLPWIPVPLARAARYAFSDVPARELIEGIEVFHPRYFMVPKVGPSLYGYSFYISLMRYVRRIRETFPFKALYAPWIYPDGFGGVMMARKLGVPVVVEALGSDINAYTASSPVRRRLIAVALKKSDGVIAVSSPLKEKMTGLGVDGSKITVITNGVDTRLFRPMDARECRIKTGLPPDGKVILFAGNLHPVKGIACLFEAVAGICRARPDVLLAVVGDGPLRGRLEKAAASKGIAGNVLFAGRRPHEDMPVWMNACDVFCLPSLDEGCPNVVLEALSCGKSVVASKVGGIPDIITSPDRGILVPPGDAGKLAGGIVAALASPRGRGTRIERDWRTVAREVYGVLRGAALK